MFLVGYLLWVHGCACRLVSRQNTAASVRPTVSATLYGGAVRHWVHLKVDVLGLLKTLLLLVVKSLVLVLGSLITLGDTYARDM